MIAGMFVLYGGDYAELCKLIGKNSEANAAEIHVQKMIQSVNQHGWDGEWFLRAYDHFGQKIGSKENKEGKIFIACKPYIMSHAVTAP